MRGFARRHTVAAALEWLDAQLRSLDAETVPLGVASGRVLASSVASDVDVPGFDRATMDGYAVVAAGTEGAGAYNRLSLTVVGDSMPGRPFEGSIRGGEAVRVMTGAPIPAGADAVLPAEFVDVEGPADAGPHDEGPPSRLRQGSGGQEGGHYVGGHYVVSGTASVSPGKNVGRRGEDIVRGATLLEAGRVLRPQDLGVLSSVGHGQVSVVRRPRVRLVVTGNELLPAGSRPHGFHIADANGPMLAALVERDGGVVEFPGLVRDERQAILDALNADADIVIVSGGSSVGIEDLGAHTCRRARRAADTRHRHAPEQPDWPRANRSAASVSASRQSGLESVRLRFLCGPRHPRTGRTSESVAVPLDSGGAGP